MNPPRRIYGPRPPGRLQATMLKVLAAELSDAGRLGRGKRYFNDGAVTDIDIAPGIVQAEVQGSRSDPYVASIVTASGSGVPGRADVRAVCDCPDADDPTRFCKHAVAATFALANEVAIEPDLLDLWRSGEDADRTRVIDVDDEPLAEIIELFPGSNRGRGSAPADHEGLTDADATTRTDDHDRDVDEVDDDEVEDDDDGDEAAEINAMLVTPHSHSPTGPRAVEFGDVTAVVHPSTGDRVVDRLIREMLDEVDIQW